MVKGLQGKLEIAAVVNQGLNKAVDSASSSVAEKEIRVSSATVSKCIGEETINCVNISKEINAKRVYIVASQKKTIYKENKGKSGIYRFICDTTGKSYIGSAVDLRRRFSEYFSLGFIRNELKKGNSAIYSSLLKHGHSNFRLEILEYCNKEMLIRREQHYIDLLKPEYNLAKLAHSCLGYKHTKEARANMSAALTGRTLTVEHRANIGAGNAGRVFSPEHRANLSASKGTAVEVTDLKTGSVVEYTSLNKAAKVLGTHIETIRRCVLAKKVFNGTYLITKKS